MAQTNRDDDPDHLGRLADTDPAERMRALDMLHGQLYQGLLKKVFWWQKNKTPEAARCADEAQDVVQEALKRFAERLMRKPFPADELAGVRAYLGTVAWNVFHRRASDPVRADRRAADAVDFEKLEADSWLAGPDGWDPADSPSGPGQEVPKSLMEEIVVAATRSLSKRDQELLRLRADKVPYEGIGAALGLSPGYAKKRHCEVLKRLAASIQSLLLQQEPATRNVLQRRLGLDDGEGPTA